MAGLTAEQFRQEMGQFYAEIGQLRQETADNINLLRRETANSISRLQEETSSGFGQVLDTMQAFHDSQRDELIGINGRLRDHSERIGRLERLNHNRA